MAQWMLLSLLFAALVLPIIGAAVLRLSWAYLGERARAVLAIAIFGITFGALFMLARSDIASLRVAGLTVLLPIAAPVEAPTLPPQILETPLAPDPDITPTPTPSPRPDPTFTPRPTSTPTATVTPTASATATPEPTAPPEPTTAPAPQGGQRRYTVQPGDTLRSIAETNGVSVDALLRANNLTPQDADNLRIGQELVIP